MLMILEVIGLSVQELYQALKELQIDNIKKLVLVETSTFSNVM